MGQLTNTLVVRVWESKDAPLGGGSGLDGVRFWGGMRRFGWVGERVCQWVVGGGCDGVAGVWEVGRSGRIGCGGAVGAEWHYLVVSAFGETRKDATMRLRLLSSVVYSHYDSTPYRRGWHIHQHTRVHQ